MLFPLRARVATTSENPRPMPRLPFIPLGHPTYQPAGPQAGSMTPTRTLEVARIGLHASPHSPRAWNTSFEEHYGAACTLLALVGAVEEAWRCGDALIAAKGETKLSAIELPALKAVEITP